MTGFGASAAEFRAGRIRIELRSVNHRYLKVGIGFSGGGFGGSAGTDSGPRWSGRISHQIEERIRQRLSRGSLAVNVVFEGNPTESDRLIDADRARQLHSELEALRAEIAPQDPAVSLEALLRVPAVLRGATETQKAVGDGEESAFASLVDAALDDLDSMQRLEGAHLQAELLGIGDCVEASLADIQAALPEVAVGNRERFRKRLDDILEGTGVQIEDSDLIREVALLAEKADVTEEVSRLRGHFEQFRALVTDGGKIGRKLDFLTQEMFREANTMAAKVSRHEITHRVVDIKADIDRLREQSQNIE